MKRTTFIFIIACVATLAIVACKNTQKKETVTEISPVQKAVDVNGLLSKAEQQINDTIVLKGIVTQEYIDNWEKELAKEEADGEKDEAHCNSEKNSILQMREWMKNNNKDFYAIYYVNGIDYDMVK